MITKLSTLYVSSTCWNPHVASHLRYCGVACRSDKVLYLAQALEYVVLHHFGCSKIICWSWIAIFRVWNLLSRCDCLCNSIPGLDCDCFCCTSKLVASVILHVKSSCCRAYSFCMSAACASRQHRRKTFKREKVHRWRKKLTFHKYRACEMQMQPCPRSATKMDSKKNNPCRSTNICDQIEQDKQHQCKGLQQSLGQTRFFGRM